MTPQIINYLISIALLSFVAGMLIKKRRERPDLKFFGLPLTAIIMLNLGTILLFAVLLIFTAAGIAR
jgi:hypothetical protein